MAPGSYACRRPCVNTPVDLAGELDKLVGAQSPARRSNAGSDEALIPLEASTPPFVPPTSKDLFTKFMKVFMETTQAQAQVLAEPQKRPLKARTPETYSGKSHMDCYHFCQQCEDYFETSGAMGMNHTPFATTFLCGTVSLRWAQHKRRHKSATPITWSEFKNFLRKNLGDSQAFINSIWSKFRRDFQYQLEEAQDYASHLQHLQLILVEFGTIGAPNEPTMVCYFQEGLKPSIKVEMKQQNWASTSFKEIVQRTVNVEAKAGLRSSTIVRDSDARSPRGHRLSHNTFSKVQTQGTTAKKPRAEEPWPKEAKQANGKAPTPLRSDELIKPTRQKKKKKYWKKKGDRKNSSPATKDNAIEGKKGDGKCYNCQKKGHIMRNCPEPPKN